MRWTVSMTYPAAGQLTRNGRPAWTPATEDRGEGIFLQLDLDQVAAWESMI